MSDVQQRRHSFPAVNVRIEPNHDGRRVVWNVQCDDGTRANGFASSRVEAMQKVIEIVEATARAAALSTKPTLVHDAGHRVLKDQPR